MQSIWLDPQHLPMMTTDPFSSGAEYDAVIAGAGITGLATAVLLARAGQRVAVLEARSVGAAATGNTTAKLSLLQGTTLSDIREHQSDKVLRAYVQGNAEGQAWLLRYLESQGAAFQRRTAYTYSTTESGLADLHREFAAGQAAELPVTWAQDTELPFPVTGALALRGQAQFNPMEVLAILAAELRERDGEVIEGVRVTGAGIRAPLTVRTTRGNVRTTRLILSTGSPVLDRGGYFAKLEARRSYALTYRLPGLSGSAVEGMYLSADAPDRTLRSVPSGGEELLLVGGNDHVVGRAASPRAAVDDLEQWTQRHFPGAERTHAWSAQDYRSVNYIPFIGTLPRGGGNIFVATGFNKWGLSNGVAAALAISAEILGGNMPWATTMGHRLTTGSDLMTGLKDGASVARAMATGWASGQLRALPSQPPPKGEGHVGRHRGRPVGVATVDGTQCRVSAVCPHLGGVLGWNDAEQSWDCPLHGSRFSAEGSLLEGPAVSDLSRPAN